MPSRPLSPGQRKFRVAPKAICCSFRIHGDSDNSRSSLRSNLRVPIRVEVTARSLPTWILHLLRVQKDRSRFLPPYAQFPAWLASFGYCRIKQFSTLSTIFQPGWCTPKSKKSSPETLDRILEVLLGFSPEKEGVYIEGNQNRNRAYHQKKPPVAGDLVLKNVCKNFEIKTHD